MYKVGFWSYYKEEVKVIRDRDPAIKKDIEAILYPSFWAIYNYRRAHKLYERGKVFKARRISQRTARKTGIEIHPGAKIGKGLFIDHGHGVVIGETAILGDNITLEEQERNRVSVILRLKTTFWLVQEQKFLVPLQ